QIQTVQLGAGWLVQGIIPHLHPATDLPSVLPRLSTIPEKMSGRREGVTPSSATPAPRLGSGGGLPVLDEQLLLPVDPGGNPGTRGETDDQRSEEQQGQTQCDRMASDQVRDAREERRALIERRAHDELRQVDGS